MRILLFQYLKGYESAYPIGLGLVASSLMKSGHTIGFIDLTFSANPFKAFEDNISEFKPEVIGTTLYTPRYHLLKELFRSCKSVKNLNVILGGPHACAASKEVLRDGMANFIVRGEGETIAPKLIDAMEKKHNLREVKGIAYIDKNGEYVETPDEEPIQDLDALPEQPYTLFKVWNYKNIFHGHPSADIMTSRGCPYNCIFCYRGPTSRKKKRYRSIQKVFDEIVFLNKNFKFKVFNIRDDIFTLKRDRALAFCEKIISSGLKIYWICQTRVDKVDLELLKKMKEAGCISILFGVESGNQDVINYINKKFFKDEARQAFSLCQSLRIPTIAFFILGTPIETEATMRETIDFAKELKSTISVFFPATPYPGTQLEQLFIKEGIKIPDNLREFEHFIEGVSDSEIDSFSSDTREDYYRKACLKATKEIIKAQIGDIKSYPRILREMIYQYGIIGFLNRAFKRIFRS